jgi:hypothetical protein
LRSVGISEAHVVASPDLTGIKELQLISAVASYQYVLYGMNFKSDLGEENRRLSSRDRERARILKDEIDAQSNRYLQHLPRHRSLISEAIAQGFAT